MGLAWLAFLMNFLGVTAYYIIGPLRSTFILAEYGAAAIPWVYMASAVTTGAAVWIYSQFTHLPRRRLIGGALIALVGTLLGSWALARRVDPTGAFSFGFYLWSDIFGIMSMTLLWTFINDIFSWAQAKRSFGFIAAGAPLGAIFGSWLTQSLVHSIGMVELLLVASIIYAAAAGLFFVMERIAKSRNVPRAHVVITPVKPTGVLPMIFKSRFLVLLTALVLCERMVPDFAYYLFNAVTREAYPVKEDLAGTLARFGLWQNLVSFLASLLLTRYVLGKVGIAGALVSPGVANLIGFALFPFFPTLPLVVGHNGVEGILRYTWFKSAKEATYTVADREVIFRVKAFVEMFVYRFARGLAGLMLVFLTARGDTAVALVGVPLALFWIWAARSLGKEFWTLAKGETKDDMLREENRAKADGGRGG